MFCSDCGTEADGKFCWRCGAALHGSPVASPPQAAAPVDWSDQVRHDVLMTFPPVRAAIARAGAQARKPLSGEDILKACDKLALSVVSLEAIGQLAVPLWTSLGVKSGTRTRTEIVARPCGHVIVAALCSLARNSQALIGVDQAADGCTIHGEQPSDFRSLRGEIKVTLIRHGPATRVEAGAWSNGQFFDWGKSNASLERLIDDLRAWKVAG